MLHARSTRRAPAALAAGLLTLAAACSGGGGGGAGGAAADGAGDTADRCDLGFNTPAFNEATAAGHDHGGDAHDHGAAPASHVGEPGQEADYTIEEWAAEFSDEGLGLGAEELAAGVRQNPQLLHAVTSGGLAHTLGPDPWVPLTDPAACDALAGELRQARQAAARFPTVAAATAAGYAPGGQNAPGQGAHFVRVGSISGEFDPADPPLLMFDGTGPDADLVGMAFYVVSTDGPPEGFTGDNDAWHAHSNLCQNAEGVAIGADMTEAECSAIGGTLAEGMEGAWMLHAWLVPGCESDWGVFSGANPDYPAMPPGADYAAGCDTGAEVSESLTLDDPGPGPDVSM